MTTVRSTLAEPVRGGAVGGMSQHGIREIQLALDPSPRRVLEFPGHKLSGNAAAFCGNELPQHCRCVSSRCAVECRVSGLYEIGLTRVLAGPGNDMDGDSR